MQPHVAHQPEPGGRLALAGRVLAGRWHIMRPLADGSYAEIHLARDLTPPADAPAEVVVKTLNPSLRETVAADWADTLTENFWRETRANQALNHPHIARCYASGTALDAAGRHFAYLVLEHLAGGSLAPADNRPLPLSQALDYLGQAASALSYVHAQGLLHRDLKPANLLLTADRRTLKLTDFGTVRALADAAPDITVVGTAAYAAPEHYGLPSAAGVRRLTPAADVYALAKTFYALLCGVAPRAFSQRPLTHWPPATAAEPWAGAVLFVLARATSHQPAPRYQSATELYEALCAACDQTVATSREPNRAQPRLVIELNDAPQPHGFQPFHLRRALAALATACALLLGVPLAWRAWPPAAPPPQAAAPALPPAQPKRAPKRTGPRPSKPLKKR